MSKENQRVVISKRMLKDGIMTLLNKKHINEISVVELCELSGINRTTFYRHYQTPHDILMEIELDFIKDFNDTVPKHKHGIDAKQYSIELCQYIFERKDIVKMFIQNNTDGDLAAIVQDFTNSFLVSRKMLYKGRTVGSDAFRLMQTFFLYGIYALIRQWIVEDVPISSKDIAEMISGFFGTDFSLQ